MNQTCRICLESNRKLYNMNENNYNTIYECITGIFMTNADQLPNKICWECAHRLTTFWKFKHKAMRSYNLMIGILHSKHCLTQNLLQSIDRNLNDLTSNLACKYFDVNYSDLHIHDPTTDISSAKEFSKWPDENFETLNLDLKFENDKNSIENCSYEDNNLMIDQEISTGSSDIVLSIKKLKTKKVKQGSKKEKIEKKIDRRRKPAKEILNEDIFSITDLSYEEQLLEVIRRKEGSNYKKSEFKCEECFKGFCEEDAYKCHSIRHTEQSGSYECEICKVRFKKQHALRNHVTSHMQKFCCKQCPYVTTRRHAAKLHEEYHNGTRYNCPHCQEDFGKFSTYMSHIRIKHPSDYICELCGYSFISEKGLSLHKKLKHRFDEHIVAADGPSCDACGVRFATEDALSRHLKLSARHNDGETKDNYRRRTRETEEYGTEDNEKQKRRNKNNCKPEGPIPCEQCDIQLPDSISYYRHFRRSHPDKNRTNYPSMKTKCMCEVCGKMFQSLALLQDHSFTHTDSKQFKCAQCGKCFQRKYRLIAHRRLHAAQRASHACSVCGKRFTTTSNMQRHMVSHTGLKPFKCEMCGKCFKHASEKRVHITYVHLKKPWPKRSRGKRRADSRQSQLPLPPSEDLVQPLWPACSDPKMNDITNNKPIYYNLKI